MVIRNSRLSWASRAVIGALALSACAAPTGMPTAIPLTALPTATAPPPTAVAPLITPSRAAPTAVLATMSKLEGPNDIAFDRDGNLYVSECSPSLPGVLKIDSIGLLTAVAGVHSGFGGDGGPAVDAEIACAQGLAFDRDGNLYVVDQFNCRIRGVDRNGVINTVAGSGAVLGTTGGQECSFGGDGSPATEANLCMPTDIAFDAEGNMYISDGCNSRIRRVDIRGLITTIAGTGQAGYSGDGGLATAAQLGVPRGLAVDALGNLYIADPDNSRVRKIDPQGIITTIAGNGQSGTSGDGGPAVEAALSVPTGLAFDAAGNLYVTLFGDYAALNSRVRKIDAAGIITTVAGPGERDVPGDGDSALAAGLRGPAGITFDAAGNLYIADAVGARVRKIDENGIITTVAGGAP